MAREGKMFAPVGAAKVYKGEVYDIWQWQQELYDGSKATFEGLARPDTAHTIGILPNRTILLVEDEQPDREAVITPAGGRLKDGEKPGEGARREFLEETGYEIGNLKPWHNYQPQARHDWTVHVFIGQQLTLAQTPEPEAGERIKILLLTFEDFLQLGRNPKLRDINLRIQLLEALLDTRQRAALERVLFD
jgi:ADP-ribose pyrophosphatase